MELHRILALSLSAASVACVIESGGDASTVADATEGGPTTGEGEGSESGALPPTSGAEGSSSTGTGDSASETGIDDTAGLPCEPGEVAEVRGCDEIVGEAFCSEGQMHVPEGSEVEWGANPPHSGPHYPSWELWGEHDSTVPRGNWVHNLEHGGIALLYRCAEACEAELEVLRAVMSERPELRILLTPDPALDGPRFAAVAWTWVYETDAPDLATLLCFVDQHENHAPEDVP